MDKRPAAIVYNKIDSTVELIKPYCYWLLNFKPAQYKKS